MRLSAHPFVLAAALVSLSACAHIARTGSTDLVVIGQVDTLDSEVLDEWGLNVKFTGRLKIIRILRGAPPPSSSLPVRYIAHSSYASDRELQFRLRRVEDGSWLICSRGGGRGYICH